MKYILISLALGFVSDADRPQNAIWSYDGHRIVCEIAWQYFTPRTKNEVRALLEEDPDYTLFNESCVWADEVRRTHERFDRFTTAHYMNVPRGASSVDVNRDCADGPCVITEIYEQRAILVNENERTQARLEALKWIAHFIGDVHQPLHVSYEDDAGGNRHDVVIWGEEANLHWVWDGMLIRRADIPWREYADRLTSEISAVDRLLWNSLDVELWANESFQITENYIYSLEPGEELGDEYYLENLRTVEQRLKMAGIRLANFLNDVFD